jgi:hypothetical protein
MVAKTDNEVYSHPIFDVYIEDEGGMLPNHNMPCAVCYQAPAVLNCDSGTFEPCWKCQEEGWQLHFRQKGHGLFGARRVARWLSKLATNFGTRPG